MQSWQRIHSGVRADTQQTIDQTANMWIWGKDGAYELEPSEEVVEHRLFQFGKATGAAEGLIQRRGSVQR